MHHHRIRIGLALSLAVTFAAIASAQTGPRHKDVIVRLRTEHYAIGGTVSDARLREYGRLLEFIYAEYDKGFTTLLTNPADKSKSSPAGKSTQQKPGAKNENTGSNGDKKGTRSKSSKGDRDSKPGQIAPKETNGTSKDNSDSVDGEDADDALFPVAIFSNTQEYQAQTRQHLGHDAEHTSGMYIPGTRMLLIADQGNMRDTQEVLFHEAFHQFLDKYVADPPMWLNEGLAMHYGSAVPAGNGVAFTNIPTKRWKLAREAINEKKAIPIDDVISAPREKFYDKTPVRIDDFENVTRSSLYYSEAYIFVHMLLNDAEGKKRLQNYIRDLARDRGDRTAEITDRYFDDKTCAQLSPHWIKYVKSGPRSR